MKYLLLLFIIFFVGINLIICYESGFRLSSKDFEELLKKDRLKRHLTYNGHHQKSKNNKIITTTWKFIPADDVDYKKTSDEILRKRKVWSRWGKWGECSVTCGEGTISRKRVCVLGRCAPGEMEEQRHPCNRSPCLQLDVDERREQD